MSRYQDLLKLAYRWFWQEPSVWDEYGNSLTTYLISLYTKSGSCHKRQKPQAPTPQAPIRNRQTRKVANAKGLNRNTNLT